MVLLFPLCVFPQYNQMARNAFMGAEIQQAFDFWSISQPDLKFHSAFRPYLSSTFANANDSVLPFKAYAFRNYFLSRTFNEKPEKRNWFNVQLHPIIDLEPGYDLVAGKPVTSAIGGTHVKLNINDDFTFAGSLFGGKRSYPFFQDTAVGFSKILPEFGQGYGERGKGYTFWDYSGYISYSPKNNKVFNFQAGRDKHFIGDGHRSVLLSDFAPAYPFFRMNANLWRIQYNVWYTWMNDVSNANGFKSRFTNKYGTFHYLSFNIMKELNVGLFENIVWRGTDSNQVRTFEVNYLNPVIFFRPQEYAVGSPDNSFIGLNINATLFKTVRLYGQLALDEFFLREIRARRGWWANKQGWQLGAKAVNALGVKGLKLQAEYNEVRPYTYTHGLVDQNYGHYGMPLAHPFGANFRELLGFVSYREGRMELSLQGTYVLVGKDTTGSTVNMGQNIFTSYNSRPYEFGHYTTQGIKHTVMQSHIKLTYFVIPNLNMRLELGYIQRSEENEEGYALENPYLYIAFRTSFWNNYRDF